MESSLLFFWKKGDYETLAYVRYLNPTTNPNNLRIGSKIELFEGAKKVAYGEILEEADFDYTF